MPTQLRSVQQTLAGLPPDSQGLQGVAEFRKSLEEQKESLQDRIRDSRDPWQRQKALLATIESMQKDMDKKKERRKADCAAIRDAEEKRAPPRSKLQALMLRFAKSRGAPRP